MKLAAKLLKLLAWLEQSLTSLAFATMVLALGWDIFSREVLGGGRIWATPIAVYCNVLIAFVGIGIASASGAHLRPKFFDKLAPTRLHGMLDRLTDFGFAAFAAAAGFLCWKVVAESIKLQETDNVMQWQVWPFQCLLVLGFGMAVLRHVIYGVWPALRPESVGENDAPSEEQMQALKVDADAALSPSRGAAK